MKKLLFSIILVLSTVTIFGQVTNKDIEIRKTTPAFRLNGTGAIIDFYNNDVRITHSSNKITVTGGNVQVPKLLMPGATSGTATLQPPAVAGATVHTLPSTTGTLVNATDVSSTYATIASPAFTGSVPTSGGLPLGRITSITGTFTAGALTDVTLTGVTTKPYNIMIQTTAGKDITSAVSDSLAFTGGVYHLHVYSVDLITDAEIKVTY